MSTTSDLADLPASATPFFFFFYRFRPLREREEEISSILNPTYGLVDVVRRTHESVERVGTTEGSDREQST